MTCNVQHVSTRCRTFIEGFEDCVLYVYDDMVAPQHGAYVEWDGSVPIGTLTIGFGHTDAARDPLKITQGLRITRAQADAILTNDLGECEEQVAEGLANEAVTQAQFDALVSFTFNCGPKALGNVLQPWVRQNSPDGTCGAMGGYTHSKGKYMLGLARRRSEEQAMFKGMPYIPSPPDELIPHPADVHTAIDDEVASALKNGAFVLILSICLAVLMKVLHLN
jgi:GH24 family phage-related lysozyme (muramidase)